MPQFRYQATDAYGRVVEGQIQANDAAEATNMLGTRGYQVRSITDINLQQRVQTPQMAQPAVRPVAAGAVGARPQETVRPMAAPSMNTIAQKPTVPARKTKAGSEKLNFFLFSQLASLLRAGINPAQAFGNVAGHTTRDDYREAFTRASQAAAEGRPASEVLSEYPDLFLPYISGLLRAGEQGGFLPEVAEAISRQSKESYQYKLVFRILQWVWVSFLVSIPVGLVAVEGGLKTWDMQTAVGGMGGASQTFMVGLKDAFIQALPFIIPALIIYFAIRAWWGSRGNRARRHRLVLRLPAIGKRATHESIAVLCWILGLLGKAGSPPKTSLEIAASAMPNLELSEQFGSVAHRISENVSLSDALRGHPKLPAEFIPMISTGEVTGDVATQLFHLSEAARVQFKAEEQGTKWRTGCWIAVLMFIFFAFTVWLIYGRFYGGVSDKLDEEVRQVTTG